MHPQQGQSKNLAEEDTPAVLVQMVHHYSRNPSAIDERSTRSPSEAITLRALNKSADQNLNHS